LRVQFRTLRLRMMSRLATIDCHATRSNYLLWSEIVLGGIVTENKGDRYRGRENTHRAGSTISREEAFDNENDNHLQYVA